MARDVDLDAALALDCPGLVRVLLFFGWLRNGTVPVEDLWRAGPRQAKCEDCDDGGDDDGAVCACARRRILMNALVLVVEMRFDSCLNRMRPRRSKLCMDGPSRARIKKLKTESVLPNLVKRSREGQRRGNFPIAKAWGSCPEVRCSGRFDGLAREGENQMRRRGPGIQERQKVGQSGWKSK